MFPTHRTALVETTRWSMICIASAPPAHRALTTAWTSCWCTTTSSGLVPSGSTRSAERGASDRVTVTLGPVTVAVPAASSRPRERRCAMPIRRSAAPARSVASSTSARSPSTRWVRSSASCCSARIRSPRSLRVPRSWPPLAAPALVAKSTPAAAKATGAATRQSAFTGASWGFDPGPSTVVGAVLRTVRLR